MILLLGKWIHVFSQKQWRQCLNQLYVHNLQSQLNHSEVFSFYTYESNCFATNSFPVFFVRTIFSSKFKPAMENAMGIHFIISRKNHGNSGVLKKIDTVDNLDRIRHKGASHFKEDKKAPADSS